jgi:methionyl aminopeptidase
VVRAYCGHGIGDLFHCAPDVLHYAKNKAKGTMKVGEVFTIGGGAAAGVGCLGASS